MQINAKLTISVLFLSDTQAIIPNHTH